MESTGNITVFHRLAFACELAASATNAVSIYFVEFYLDDKVKPVWLIGSSVTAAVLSNLANIPFFSKNLSTLLLHLTALVIGAAVGCVYVRVLWQRCQPE